MLLFGILIFLLYEKQDVKPLYKFSKNKNGEWGDFNFLELRISKKNVTCVAIVVVDFPRISRKCTSTLLYGMEFMFM